MHQLLPLRLARRGRPSRSGADTGIADDRCTLIGSVGDNVVQSGDCEMRVLVLGAGFGGLELTTRLSEEFGDAVDVVLIDQADGFIFGFSKLDVMFGRTGAEAVHHPYRDLVKPGVRFVQTTIRSIDPTARRVQTDAGAFESDLMVVALGADLNPGATPGLVEAGHEFYTVGGAFALRDVLARFEGGRVVVGVTSTPFKCPPAPSETALLLHEYLSERGLRDRSEISLVMPLPVPIPPSPAASEAILEAFSERSINWYPSQLIRELDPTSNVARFADGTELPFDLFLGVPTHHVPVVVAESGMTVDGWIPVNPLTLETSYPGVFAVGDVTSVGTPKAGVFSERQAGVAADRIISIIRGGAGTSEYDGYGTCYLEFGHDEVARVEVKFVSGQPPVGTYDPASEALAAEKAEFGASRIQRWFDRAWTTLPEPY
jgi:sulfide:quinone oxidoreductase